MARVLEREGRRGWYVDFRWNGLRYREFAGFEILKSDAEQFLAKRMREVQRGEIYDAKLEAVSFADFADDFLETDSPGKKSKDRDKGVLEMLKARWKVDLGAITPKMIEDFKAQRLKFRAPATVNKELQVIKRLFKKAVEWKRLPASPAATVQKVRVNNGRVRFLEQDEIERLFSHLPDYLREIATFARFTGARRGEILNLTWKDVDFKRGLITFRDTKNGEDGTVVMNGPIRALLESLPSPIARAQRVFALPGSSPTAAEMKLRRDWLDANRKARIGKACGCHRSTKDGKPAKKCRWCAESGIVPDFHFHDLRHQAATDLLTLGAGLNDVRDFLRHKTTAMTLRYAHLIQDRRSRTAHLLDALASPAAMDTTAGTSSEAIR